jgi:hypothetical protein
MASIFRRRGDRPVASPGGRGNAQDSRTHRALLALMGPAQLGDPNEPPAATPLPDVTECRGCGRPWSEHRIVRDVFSPYSICPKDLAQLS